MVQERLNKIVLRRLKELGLPPSLLDLGEFRDNFFSNHWVMFVRDHDKIADVHLVQSQKDLKSLGRNCARIRLTRRNR
jgi:hypothetical protein